MPLEALVTGRIATLAGDAGFGWVEAVGISGGRVAFAGSAVELETRADPYTRPVRARPGRGRDPGPDRRPPPPRRGRHRRATRSTCRRRRRSRPPSPRSGRPARPGPTAGAGSRATAGTRTGSGAGRPPTTSSASRPDGGSRSGPTTTTRSGRAARRSRPPAIEPRHRRPRRRAHPPRRRRRADRRPPRIGGPARRPTTSRRRRAERYETLIARARGGPRPAGRRRGPRSGRRCRSRRASAPGSPRSARSTSAATLPHPRPRLHPRGADRGGGRRPGCAAAIRSGRGADRARFGWLKLFADGTLASRTAALLEPIEAEEGRPLPAGTERGVFLTPPERLAALARAGPRPSGSRRSSTRSATGACRAALDALEPTAGTLPLMPRLEHVQLLHPDDRGPVRAGRDRGVGPADPPPRRRRGRAPAVGRPRGGERLHVAVDRRHRRGARVRDGRAGRADRPVAGPVDGGHPARRDVAGRTPRRSGRTRR